MGKIEKIIDEKIIDPEAAHNSNLLRIYRAPNQEVTIHYKNLKIVLHTHEVGQWKQAFAEALKKINSLE